MMAVRSLLLISLCCLVGMAEIVSCEYEPNRDYYVKNTLQELNKHLVDETKSLNPEDNFNVARKLYAKHRKTKKIDKKLLEADELFLALSSINDGNICTPHSNSIILNMSKNLREDRGPMSFPTRIERIFGSYFDRWMRICAPSLPKVLREKLAIMDRVKLSYLDTFFDEAIALHENMEDEYSRGKSIAFRLMNMASGFTYVKEVRQCDYILRKLKEIAQTDPRAKSEEDRTIFAGDEKEGIMSFKEEKFQDYYVEPCKYFEEQLGNSVFNPAFLAYKVSGRKLFSEDDLDFYRAWIKYKLCSRNTDLSAFHLREYSLGSGTNEAGLSN